MHFLSCSGLCWKQNYLHKCIFSPSNRSVKTKISWRYFSVLNTSTNHQNIRSYRNRSVSTSTWAKITHFAWNEVFLSKILLLCRRSSVTIRFTKPKKWPWVEICTKVKLSNDWNGEWILLMVSERISCTNSFTHCHHHLSLRSKERIGSIDSLRWENRRTAPDANTLVFCEIKQTLSTRSINGAKVNY